MCACWVLVPKVDQSEPHLRDAMPSPIKKRLGEVPHRKQSVPFVLYLVMVEDGLATTWFFAIDSS